MMKFTERVREIWEKGGKSFLIGGLTGTIIISSFLVLPDKIEQFLEQHDDFNKRRNPHYELEWNQKDLSSSWSNSKVESPYDLLEAYIEKAGRDKLQGLVLDSVDSSLKLDLGLPHNYKAVYERELTEEQIDYLLEEVGTEDLTIYSNDFRVELEGDQIEVVGYPESEKSPGLQEAVQDFSFPAKQLLEGMEIPYQVEGDEIDIRGRPQDILSSEEVVGLIESLPADAVLEASRNSKKANYSVFFGDEGFGYEISSYKLRRDEFEDIVEETDNYLSERGLIGKFEPEDYFPRLLIFSQISQV